MRIIGFFAGLLLLFLQLPIFAADSYNYDLPDFQKIEISGSMTVVLEKRSDPGLYIELDNSSIDDLSWYVSVKTLVLRKKYAFPDFRNIKIIVYYNDEISSIEVKKRALVKNIRKLRSKKILIEAVSGGIVDLRIDSQKMEIYSKRSSKIKLIGKCGKLYAQADAGGVIDSYSLASDYVQASSHTQGIIKVNALLSVDASSGLGSKIYIKGNPQKKAFVSGTGGDIIEVK
jgi:putative autotransporter adhesin-like protein